MRSLYVPPPGIEILPEFIDFKTGLAWPPYEEGRIFYDSISKTLGLYNNESDVILQLGQEIYIRVYNDTGVQIDKGSLVYISGVSGGYPKAILAKADAAATSNVVAMATHNIGDGVVGFITVMGLVVGLNTNAFTVGTLLYLSDTVAGEWSSTVPTAPSFPIQIGTVMEQSATTGRILVNMGETNVSKSIVIHDLEINEDLRVNNKLTLKPSTVTDITAAGGITVTNATMRVQGDGGPINITANPQIVAGADGQFIFLIGQDDTNTIQLADGNGLHLLSGSPLFLGKGDYLNMQYDSVDAVWKEVGSNFQSMHISWSYVSPPASFGTEYVGGFYKFGTTSYTPAGGTVLGTANVAYGAHAFIVLGASSTDMVVRVTGTSITNAGVRVASDTEDIDTSGGVLNDYFETTKKWIGQITISLQSGTGVAINDGLCKYWNNWGTDFRVTGLDIKGIAGANDTGVNFGLIYHNPTGWTFNSGAPCTPPNPLVSFQGDYDTEYQLVVDEPFSWKRIGLTPIILGNQQQGIIGLITTSANNAIRSLNWDYVIRAD